MARRAPGRARTPRAARLAGVGGVRLTARVGSALSRRFCDEVCRRVLYLLASAFRAHRVTGLVLGQMLGVLELFTARFAAVFVGGHDKPPARSRDETTVDAAVSTRHCGYSF